MTDPEYPYSEDELKILESLRALQGEDWQLDSPPARVWAGIEQEIRDQTLGGHVPTPLTGVRPSSGSPATTPSHDQPTVGTARRSSHRWWSVAAAVVAAMVVGVGALTLFGDDRPAEVVLASAELTSDELDGAPEGLRGDARVVKTDIGQVVHIDIGDLRPASGEFLEVWLIRPDVSGMVSLGTARPDGRYELPPGLRLADFPIVDVSTESYDGDPAHSGLSLLRGMLPT